MDKTFYKIWKKINIMFGGPESISTVMPIVGNIDILHLCGTVDLEYGLVKSCNNKNIIHWKRNEVIFTIQRQFSIPSKDMYKYFQI